MPPVEQVPGAAGAEVEDLISQNKIVIFSKTTCPWCVKVKALFKELGEEVKVVEVDTASNGAEIKDYLTEKTKQSTVPNVFVNGTWIGGHDATVKANKEGRLAALLKPETAEDDAKPKPGQSIEDFVNNAIKKHRIMVFSKSTCPFCAKVKELFKSLNQPIFALELDEMGDDGAAIRDHLFEKTGQKTVPNVFVNGTHLGGCDNTLNAHSEGRLDKLLASKEPAKAETPPAQAESAASKEYVPHNFDYDLIVIGGGSGGLACSKMAASLGAKVAVLDFVKPTPIGTTWGLGGTCVNVGCIPKKLMHQAAVLGESLNDSRPFGWQTPENIAHNWTTMRDEIMNYIGSLNFGYRVQLRDKKVDYVNAYGQFIDKNKLLCTYKNGKTKELTAQNIVIATGGRPKYPDGIKGIKENTITSDDLFSLQYSPGKTLCVGASYVSLECAGFLHGIGLDVTVMVRSILLRGFDQQMANLIGDFMETHGVKFVKESVPTEIIKIRAPVINDEDPSQNAPGEYLVKFKDGKGEIHEDKFNTVLYAVGRDPCTSDLNIDNVGVKINPKNSKIFTNFEQTNVPNIYAIGDVMDEKSANGRLLELTPVAIKAGELLAKRIYGKSDVKMDYFAVATTVFTPIEYGSIGFSEEESIEMFGDENIDVYHTNFWPLEWTVAHKPNDVCYAKLIVNKKDNERVVGLHVAGPNAGEITQGYAIAFRLRATKTDFDMTVGIHPTVSETFTTLKTTKKSGESVVGSGC